MKVAVLGASGTTGRSIVDGLLSSTEIKFEVTALVRPSSLEKPDVVDLKLKGINIQAADLDASEEKLGQQLQGQDVVIAAISIPATMRQMSLANAVKVAGVKRFVPCFFAPVATPKGLVDLRDKVVNLQPCNVGVRFTNEPPQKEDVLNHVKRLHLPYTIIDVGWWFQFSLPKLPSGLIDHAHSGLDIRIPGDGNVPSAFTDNRDIGKFVARIIADPRTLNQQVFMYSEMTTLTEIYDLLEKISSEKIPRRYISRDELLESINKFGDSRDLSDDEFLQKAVHQYWYSWGIRGENTDDHAKYLGYVHGNSLYPDVKTRSFEDYIREILSGQSV
ncbi:hypothetical protein AG0111_0g2202 [Alternaria gaisen]|uniref:Uncharacterized protein n=1 Tax=Alternaria gaisen TaxID=167740 RepID=A0ACB6FZX4_9PLEO|nr:hypothetical protein AG0111_0g2202 [Alternaria gaisen]